LRQALFAGRKRPLMRRGRALPRATPVSAATRLNDNQADKMLIALFEPTPHINSRQNATDWANS